jgi:hypothetical protein
VSITIHLDMTAFSAAMRDCPGNRECQVCHILLTLIHEIGHREVRCEGTNSRTASERLNYFFKRCGQYEASWQSNYGFRKAADAYPGSVRQRHEAAEAWINDWSSKVVSDWQERLRKAKEAGTITTIFVVNSVASPPPDQRQHSKEPSIPLVRTSGTATLPAIDEATSVEAPAEMASWMTGSRRK